MSDDDDTGMAVEAPGAVLSTGSNPTTAAEDAAHVPHVVATTNGNGKRAGSVGLEQQEVEVSIPPRAFVAKKQMSADWWVADPILLVFRRPRRKQNWMPLQLPAKLPCPLARNEVK